MCGGREWRISPAFSRNYPFVSSFSDKVEDAVRTGRYGFKVDDEYKAYAKTLRDNKRLALKMESAQRFVVLERLINARFLIISEHYRQWVSKIRTSSRS